MSYWYMPYDIIEFERIAGVGLSRFYYGESPHGAEYYHFFESF